MEPGRGPRPAGERASFDSKRTTPAHSEAMLSMLDIAFGKRASFVFQESLSLDETYKHSHQKCKVFWLQ